MSTHQKIVRNVAAVPEPVGDPTVAVPRAGEKFSDAELGARFGVPLRGGMRVSAENKCIVLVHTAGAYSGHANIDYGTAVSYMGQNADPDGIQNQQLSGNNLALSRSREDGYTVLYFIREGADLVFNSGVECVSHSYEVETNRLGQPRVVIKFKLRLVGGMSGLDGNRMESLRCPLLSELEEAKLPTETVGEYIARMANNMDPGLCTQKDVEEMDEELRQLARGKYETLDDLRAEFDSNCT